MTCAAAIERHQRAVGMVLEACVLVDQAKQRMFGWAIASGPPSTPQWHTVGGLAH